MITNTKVLCKLFDHKWQVNNVYKSIADQKYGPYNIIRKCERCNKMEVLIDMPEYKWKLVVN